MKAPRRTTGGDEGIRTPDLRLAKAALFQLSYIPSIRDPATDLQETSLETLASVSIPTAADSKRPAWGARANPPCRISERQPVTPIAARRCVDSLGMGVEDLFHHALAVLHDPAYRQANAGALHMEWPRNPPPRLARSIIILNRCRRPRQIRRPQDQSDSVVDYGKFIERSR